MKAGMSTAQLQAIWRLRDRRYQTRPWPLTDRELVAVREWRAAEAAAFALPELVPVAQRWQDPRTRGR